MLVFIGGRVCDVRADLGSPLSSCLGLLTASFLFFIGLCLLADSSHVG